MKKRLFSLLLVLCMVMSLFVACGEKKDDDDKDKDGNGTAAKTESVGDVVEQMGNFKKGSFEMGMDIALTGETSQKVTASLFGKVDGQNASLGMTLKGTVEGVAMDFSVDELLIVADGIAYINLGGVVDIAKALDEEVAALFDGVDLKWFALPLPDEYTQSTTGTISADAQKAVMDFFKDLVATGKQDGMKVTFSQASELQAAMEVIAVFLETKAESILNEAMSASSDATIDLNAYAQKLIDYYYDDLVEAAESMQMTKDDVDELLNQLKAEDLNSYIEDADTEVELPDSAELAQTAAEIRKAKESITDEDLAGGSVTIEGSQKGSTYRVSASVINTDEESAGTVSVYYEVSEESVSVSAPKDVNSLTDLVEILINFAGSGDLDF
ncbi:MAG: hypothetical protein Q4C48_04655 [Lachnospiraceae bacterium]|nr:hypothetical protein [Lachnospiraceae bacterium]